MPITLPGDGEVIATRNNPSSQDVQDISLMRSDALGTPITADANGMKVQLGLAIPAGTNNIGDVDVLSLPTLPAGTNAIGKLAANSGVDIGDVDVTSVTPGTGATNLGKAVDSAVGATDSGVAVLFQRVDTPATITPVVNDYTRAIVDSFGRQWTASVIKDAAGADLALSPPIAISATPSIDAGAYALGDNLDGNIITFANAVGYTGGFATLVGVALQDKSDLAPDLSVFLLSDSITPQAQNAAFTMSDADGEKVVAVMHTASGTWEDYVQGRKCFIYQTKPVYAAATSLYAVVRVNAAWTPTSTSDLIITLMLLR
jgi:hypothetical protein